MASTAAKLAINFQHLYNRAEDYLRRNIKPKHVVEAQRRRQQRRNAKASRAVMRGLAGFGASSAGVATLAFAAGPLSGAALLAGDAAALVATAVAIGWPERSPLGRISRKELVALAAEAEEWLLKERETAPLIALPAIDRIVFRLGDIHPHLPKLDPHGTLAWDLRRLLTQHMPRLVQSYVSLPETVRQEDREIEAQAMDGFDALDTELIRICREISQDHRTTLSVQQTFLAQRYRDPKFD